MADDQEIIEQTLRGRRLTDEEAEELLAGGELAALGRAADQIRRRRHPEPYVTFIVDRNINYTNVCKSRCKFCAFYREEDAPDAYVLGEAELHRKIQEAADAGAACLRINPGNIGSADRVNEVVNCGVFELPILPSGTEKLS